MISREAHEALAFYHADFRSHCEKCGSAMVTDHCIDCDVVAATNAVAQEPQFESGFSTQRQQLARYIHKQLSKVF